MRRPDDTVKIAFIGGDLRQLYCAVEIADMGYEAALFGFDKYEGDIGLCTRCVNVFDAVNMADAVILPMPVTKDGENIFIPFSDLVLNANDIADVVRDNTMIFGGRVGENEKKIFEKIIDYSDRESFAVANAYLTAESAVGIAMNEMNESIRDISVLVMGYGRIGKTLCSLLKGMGANVFASARKEKDFAWIRAYGYSPVDTSKVCDVVSSCKLIFNTIPDLVLGRKTLNCMQRDSLIIDLASKPGGVDFESAKALGLKTLWALAIPGRKLPKSAGRVIAKTVIDILEDEGVI